MDAIGRFVADAILGTDTLWGGDVMCPSGTGRFRGWRIRRRRLFVAMYAPIVGNAHTCRQKPSPRMRHPRQPGCG